MFGKVTNELFAAIGVSFYLCGMSDYLAASLTLARSSLGQGQAFAASPNIEI